MKKFASLLTVSALVAALFSIATPANAVAPSVHTVTPAAQTPGKSINVGATVPIPTMGESENVITHTWPADKLAYVEATAPAGWLIEYQTASGWSTSLPEDLSTLTGVRTTGTIDSRGVLNGQQELETTASSELIPTGSGTFVNASRGDGWGAFTSPKYLLNVYHHDDNYRLECHVKKTGEICGDLYTVEGLNTSNISGGVVINNKAYSFVVDAYNNGTVSVVCTNVEELPFSSCGLFPFEDLTGIGAQSSLFSQSSDGQKIWTAVNGNVLLCYDTLTQARCATESSLDVGTVPGSYSPGYTAYIGGKIFVTGNQIACFDAATESPCSGSWPVSPTTDGSWEQEQMQAAPIPHLTSGVVDGICLLKVGHECYSFDGTLIDTPPGLLSLLTTNSTKMSGGTGYWQTTAWHQNKVVWQSNPDGYNWNVGRATCYDWSIDAACVGFNTNTDIGSKRYSISLDDQNPTCVLANGDDGNIYAFDINSGEFGCKSFEGKVAFTSKAIAPSVSCNDQGNIHAFNSIILTAPEGLSVTDLRLTVQNASGEDVPDFIDLVPDVNGSIDLSALTIDAASNAFRFLVGSPGITEEQALALKGTLRYTADAPELCVTLRVKADCPDVWPAGESVYPQSDTTVSTQTSRKPSGGSAVTASQTSTVVVNDAPQIECASFNDLSGPEGQGLETSGDNGRQVVSMAWSPDGVLYAGGVFNDAGGDPNADYLARWNGTNWEAVGPTGNVDDGFNPAITDRVTALVFDKKGNLIVGGHFNNAAGLDLADKVAIYNPTTNTWQAPDITDTFNGNIRSMSLNPTTGKVVITGIFSSANGTSDNSGITEMDPNANYSVSPIAAGLFNNYIHTSAYGPDGTLYIGGWLSGPDGMSYMAKYDGTTWSKAFDFPNPSRDAVRAIAFNDNKMYVGGNFNGIEVYDFNSESWSWLGGAQSAVDGWVRSLLVASNGDLYIGGSFTNFNSARVIRYVDGAFIELRSHATGSVDFNYSSSYGDWRGVWDLAESPNGEIFLGGDFTDAGGNENADYITYFSAGAVSNASPSPTPSESESASPSPSPSQSSAAPSIETVFVKPGESGELSTGLGSSLPSPANSPETESIGKLGPGEGVEMTSEFGADNNSPDAAFFGYDKFGSGLYPNHPVPFTYDMLTEFAYEVMGNAACQDFTFTYRIYEDGTDPETITFATPYLATSAITVLGNADLCNSPSPSPSPSESESASPSPSPTEEPSESPSASPSTTPVPTSTKLPPRPEDKNLTGLVVKSETKIKEPTIDEPAPAVVEAAKKVVDLAPDVTSAYKVHANDADRGLVTIPTNTVIQADTSLFKKGDVVNAYLQSPGGIYFSLGENLPLDGPLVLQPMRFLKPGRYEIIVTQVAETLGFKRHYVKSTPVFGAKTTRIVVYVIPPKATVYFANHKYDLSAKAKADLKNMAVRLRGAGLVTIVGYTQTDLTSPASRAANKILSVNRAKTVAAYLRKQGLHVRMIIVGKGATNPVSVKQQYKNRRVTITYGF